MTTDQIEAERVRFEAWFYKKFNRKVLFRNPTNDEYDLGPAAVRWESWLARAEEQYASQATSVEPTERQEQQRLAMEAKHERGE